MPYKDQEKNREYQRQWRKNNPEKRKEQQRQERKQKGMRAHGSYYDFKTHLELASNSGIQNKREWFECIRLGLMPDGIFHNPDQAFRVSNHFMAEQINNQAFGRQ